MRLTRLPDCIKATVSEAVSQVWAQYSALPTDEIHRRAKAHVDELQLCRYVSDGIVVEAEDVTGSDHLVKINITMPRAINNGVILRDKLEEVDPWVEFKTEPLSKYAPTYISAVGYPHSLPYITVDLRYDAPESLRCVFDTMWLTLERYMLSDDDPHYVLYAGYHQMGQLLYQTRVTDNSLITKFNEIMRDPAMVDNVADLLNIGPYGTPFRDLMAMSPPQAKLHEGYEDA